MKFFNQYFSKWLVVFVVGWLVLFFKLSSNPTENLMHYWPFIFVGFFGAILGNISAIGGGIVFIPVMIFIYQIPPVVALKISILTQSFGMTTGAIGWAKKINIPKKIFWISIPGLLVGSLISSLLIKPSGLLVKSIFGPMSIALGLITILTTRGLFFKAKTESNMDFNSKLILVGLFFVALLGGMVTGWVAIGEGELVAAYLMIVCGINSLSAIGFGVLLLSINSIFLAGIHQFLLDGLPWDLACYTILGAVFGARLAPLLVSNYKSNKLKYLFATIAILDGIIFVVQFLISK